MSAPGAKLEEDAAVPAAVEKLLPPSARQAWTRDFVSFACDELNGMYPRLAAAMRDKAPCPPDIRERSQSIVRALSWNHAPAIDQAWSLIEGGLDRPEDAFAPALILGGLLPGDPKVQQWLAAQAAEVVAIIGSLKA